MNRKRLLLAALAGLLILSLAYAFWAMPRQEKAPLRAGKTRSATQKPAAGKNGAPSADRLHLGLLAQEQQPFAGADRDIFRFRGGGAPPVEVVQDVTPVQVMEPPPPPPPPPPPTPEELLRGQVSQITFLGFLDKGGQRIVFLSGGGELYLVKTGDSFGKSKGLLAREITDKYLVIGWPQGPETVRVELAENEALKPAIMTSGSASDGPAQRIQSTGPRSGIAGFPPRRILPQRAPAQPVVAPEQPVEENPEESPQVEEGQPSDVQSEVQTPADGVKLEELLKRRLQGGEGNGSKR